MRFHGLVAEGTCLFVHRVVIPILLQSRSDFCAKLHNNVKPYFETKSVRILKGDRSPPPVPALFAFGFFKTECKRSLQRGELMTQLFQSESEVS